MATVFPLQFNHHADDNLYADVREHLLQAVSKECPCFVPYPRFPKVQSSRTKVESTDKLDTRYNHQRKLLAAVDSRRMEVAILESKLAQMIY
jgi:hypothetical protein